MLTRPFTRPLTRGLTRPLLGQGGVDPIVISAPDGVYPGADATATGGTAPYTWMVNGVVGVIVFADEIDASFAPGDIIRLVDIDGLLSNSLTVLAIPSAPVNTTPPAITGMPIPLAVLSLSNGVWTGVVNSYTYRWEIDGLDAGVTVNTLTVPEDAEDGAVIQGFVTAINYAHSVEAESNTVEVINPMAFAFLRQPDNTIITQPDGTPILHQL